MNESRAQFEGIHDKIAEGYARREDGDSTGTCRLWLKAWPSFLRPVEETGTKSIRELRQSVRPHWLTFNWVQDLEAALWNAGLMGSSFMTAFGSRTSTWTCFRRRTTSSLRT